MRYSIHQVTDTTWELRAADGTVVATYTDRPGNTGYDQACAYLGVVLGEARLAAGDAPPASTDVPGLLPETWSGELAFSERLPGGRDFTDCSWSWRDTSSQMVPLMWMDENSEWGHLGAVLAGFVEEFSLAGGTVTGRGRYFDSEMGRYARDLVSALDGRTFPVSVDPTEAIEYEYDEECTQWDDDGFCEAADSTFVFHAYEIGGVTGCPIPGFENAGISNAVTSAKPPVRAGAPTRPPRAWMTLAEPREGEPFLDGLGDDVLVPQRDRNGDTVAQACPLTIRDDGLVYGHLTWWGQCHIGDPWGPGICAAATRSRNAYAEFLTNSVVCDDGSTVACGPLTVGCEHSTAFTAQEVRDHMAHAGMGWADVHVVDGEHGAWLSGVLRPGITDEQLRVLRALALSGEWVDDLAAVLAVNASGLPVQRIAASAGTSPLTIPKQRLAASARAGGVTKVVGANMVRACPECAKARLRGESFRSDDVMGELRAVRQLVRTLEIRTRSLIGTEADATAARLAPKH